MANEKYTHKERLETVLSGNKPDRVPVSLWRHFPVDDQNPYSLAAATTNFQNLYDFDFIKVTPASSFCLKDWGVEDCWEGNTEGTRLYIKRIIRYADDWGKLDVLDPLKGHLGDQIGCLKLLMKDYSPGTPIIQTIFNPLAQAKNLAGNDLLLAHMRQFPDALCDGLEKITLSIVNFIEELVKNNLDGIFYAIQHAQYTLLSISEFERFSKPYDLRVMDAASSMWFNLLHLHGENIMFDQVVDYPMAVMNWHDQNTPPSLEEGIKKIKGVVCGGLRQWETMVIGTPRQVRYEAHNAIQDTDGKRFILGTGCVTPIIAPHGNILAARQVVSEEA